MLGKISVWSSPATDELNIEAKGGVVEAGRLTVIDSDGRIVLEESFDFGFQKSKLDLSSLGAGLYTLVLQSAHNYTTEKLVVFR